MSRAMSVLIVIEVLIAIAEPHSSVVQVYTCGVRVSGLGREPVLSFQSQVAGFGTPAVPLVAMAAAALLAMAAAAHPQNLGTGSALLAVDPGSNEDVLGPCLQQAAAGKLGGGCSAVSPSGVTWAYVMPQHTATGTIVRYLQRTLGIESCHHLHTVGHPSNVTTSFTFVANPFSRMLTNAAFENVIGQTELSPVSQVSNFRNWVLNLETPTICGQKAMHNYFPNVWVGHVESLAEDLETVLVRLGYTIPESPIVFGEEHCITSCAENSTTTSEGENTDITIPEGVEWYDEPTRQRVVEWFANDFTSFNFSTTPPSSFQDGVSEVMLLPTQ